MIADPNIQESPEVESSAGWYKEWFDRAEYTLVYQRRDDAEAEDVIDLIDRVISPAAGTSVLDVGCGRGRHAFAFARRGYEVSGIDLSPMAIDAAKARNAELGLSVHFERQDMREPFCSGCADIVVNLFTAFGYFDDDANHRKAIAAMCESLKPGGWLVQDFLNASQVQADLVPEDSFEADGRQVIQQRRIEGGRIVKEITIHSDGVTQRFVESVRLLTLEDFRNLYADCGFTIRHVLGSYDGEDYAEDSPRLILFAEKT
jgi:SAM-dependent methyltransferase